MHSTTRSSRTPRSIYMDKALDLIRVYLRIMRTSRSNNQPTRLLVIESPPPLTASKTHQSMDVTSIIPVLVTVVLPLLLHSTTAAATTLFSFLFYKNSMTGAEDSKIRIAHRVIMPPTPNVEGGHQQPG
ncbi:hypothetical protein CY34DRAFT_502921 [Suillus luteus UH-Slu-Lm8-n1]|uniref:Uncharacterized protein n=1 Tax=Suillus luteus UH-Slu-Lm8-n1 TaxID=930992 RepID=A0A0D0B799_9AGAM|nr:hypothetical protein CY34DRAFT_502921 [Suillus luteus UH-Slu-Lm8-n1]